MESTDEAETLLLDYDDNGNLSASGRFTDVTNPAAATFDAQDAVRDLTTYTWNAADRLTTYEHDADADTATVDDLTSYTYNYNGDGDRLSQTVNGETIQYLLDSQSGLTQVLGEFGPESDTYYLLGMDVLGAETDGTWGYLHDDGLGSLRMVTDDTGSITYSADYDPYGTPLATGGAAETSFGYAGEQTDATGMQYLRARYYDPGMGVFTAKDPFRGYNGIAMSMNGYSYVHGNPINYTDPSGMIIDGGVITVPVALGIAAVVSIIAIQWANPCTWPNRNSYRCSQAADVASRALNEVWNTCQEAVGNALAPEKAGSVAEGAINEINFDDPIGSIPGSGPDPTPNPNPQPRPLPVPPPQPTPSPTPDSQGIVLSLGPGSNIQELNAIRMHHPSEKIVMIDIVPSPAAMMFMMSDSNSDFIKGNYGNSNILTQNGYGQAKAAYSIYPQPAAQTQVVAAANHHLRTGGKFFVVSELKGTPTTTGMAFISQRLNGIISPNAYNTVSVNRMRNGTYGPPNIPFVSPDFESGDSHYIYGTKQ